MDPLERSVLQLKDLTEQGEYEYIVMLPNGGMVGIAHYEINEVFEGFSKSGYVMISLPLESDFVVFHKDLLNRLTKAESMKQIADTGKALYSLEKDLYTGHPVHEEMKQYLDRVDTVRAEGQDNRGYL